MLTLDLERSLELLARAHAPAYAATVLRATGSLAKERKWHFRESQVARVAARSRSTRSVTSRATATEPITAPASLTIAKVIST